MSLVLFYVIPITSIYKEPIGWSVKCGTCSGIFFFEHPDFTTYFNRLWFCKGFHLRKDFPVNWISSNYVLTILKGGLVYQPVEINSRISFVQL